MLNPFAPHTEYSFKEYSLEEASAKIVSLKKQEAINMRHRGFLYRIWKLDDSGSWNILIYGKGRRPAFKMSIKPTVDTVRRAADDLLARDVQEA